MTTRALNIAQLRNPVTVAQGGTASPNTPAGTVITNNINANGVLVGGTGTTNINSLAIGLTNQMLVGNTDAAPSWTDSPTVANLTATSNVSAAGDIVWTSDERLKTNWQDLPGNFIEQLSAVKTGTYTRTDSGLEQVGVSAQSMQKVLPVAVGQGDDGMLNVKYANAALAACVELAKRVVALEAEIKQMKGQ